MLTFLGMQLSHQGQAGCLWPTLAMFRKDATFKRLGGSSRNNFLFLRDSLQLESQRSSLPQGNAVLKSAKCVWKSAGKAGSWCEGQEEREAVGFLNDLRTIWLLILI